MPTALEHQAAQSAIADAVSTTVASLWPALDLTDLSDSLPVYTAAVASTVRKYGSASAALAASYYEGARADAGVRTAVHVTPTTPASLEQITQAVRWATKGLWSEEPKVEVTHTYMRGISEKYALDAGRSTIIRAVHADKDAHGWARIPEPGACSFCLLLAIRGAVYRSERSADFRSHDHCRCHAQPIFGQPYEPSADVRRAQQLYKQAKRGAYGPAAVRAAFRDALAADGT